MISIVVCSTKPDLFIAFEKNVAQTIGCLHEIIGIDNRANKHSIFEAYNIGLDKAKYPIVCFIHEDVYFQTQGWGRIIESLFAKDEKLGLVGIAGAAYKTKAPSNWWANASENFNYQYIAHLNGANEVERNIWGWDKIADHITEKPVAVIDGVFMALRKKTNVRFREELGGFHNYDISLSADIFAHHYKTIVTRQIDLIHFSAGTLNDSWLDSTYEFYKLFQSKLPIKIAEIPENNALERNNYIQFINRAFLAKKRKIAFFFWKEMFKSFPLTKNHLLALKYCIKCL